MKFDPYMNDLLDDPRIKNFEDLQNHFDLVERLQKSFYLSNEYSDDDIIINESLPLTEISVELFERAIEELNSTATTSTTKNIKDNKQKFSKFNLKYATRISRKACISPYCFILALIYIRRLKEFNPNYVKNNSSCDLFLCSLIVASKFLYEETVEEEIFNCEWSKLSGIDIKTLNRMEIEFLFSLNWKANVSALEFINEWIEIENLCIKNECKKRSFKYITYNELIRIFENDKIYQNLVSYFLSNLSKLIFIASFAYSSILIGILLLSKSTILNQRTHIFNNNMMINQTYDHYLIDNDYIKHDNDLTNTNEIKQINQNESNENFNSKILDLNKLNNLNLNQLNNELNKPNIMKLDNNRIQLKDLTNDLNNKCKFNEFNELINYFSSKLPNYDFNNLSDYNLRKELSFNTQPNLRKLFLEYRIY